MRYPTQTSAAEVLEIMEAPWPASLPPENERDQTLRALLDLVVDLVVDLDVMAQDRRPLCRCLRQGYTCVCTASTIAREYRATAAEWVGRINAVTQPRTP